MIQIDARGKLCPLPVIETKTAIDQLDKNDIIEVTVDNEIAVQNIIKMAKHKGLEVTSVKENEDKYIVKINVIKTNNINNANKLSSMPNESEEEHYTDCKLPLAGKEKMIVVISSNQMGNGEEELGKILIKGFVFALTKQDVLPDTIVMYNSGVKLACLGADTIEDLKYMEEQGTKVLACGTCLNYYELTDKLEVGSVTNMYEIVEVMENAHKIIKP